MRTTAFAPPYPDDIGTWLASFRHRVTNSRGNPKSPEQLGREIAVSGATVRRWESGRLRPDPELTEKLSAAYDLTSVQTSFLSQALRHTNPPVAPDVETFRRRALPLLDCDFPTFILDDLLYLRGWNSYLAEFVSRQWDRVGERDDYHLIEFILEGAQEKGVRTRLRDRVRRAILDFWYLTSDFCGTDEYRQLIDRLSRFELFREEWQRIAFLQEDDCPQIGMPRRAYKEGIGEAMLCPFIVLLPPAYQVRQFIPLDDSARSVMESLHAKGRPDVFFTASPHWASGYREAEVSLTVS